MFGSVCLMQVEGVGSSSAYDGVSSAAGQGLEWYGMLQLHADRCMALWLLPVTCCCVGCGRLFPSTVFQSLYTTALEGSCWLVIDLCVHRLGVGIGATRWK
jgi:hypothetical protein